MTSIIGEGGKSMQDKQIIELYFNRDENAISSTAEKFGKYLFKIAFNILGDEEDVNEVLNDTYLSVWNSIPPNEPEILSSYLVKLVRRKAIDRFRANTRQKRIPTEYTVSTDELDDVISGGESTESVYEAKLLSNSINSFVRSLSEINRNVFVARYYFYDSVSDISQSFGISESKVKNILFRSRKALKEYLRKEGFDV